MENGEMQTSDRPWAVAAPETLSGVPTSILLRDMLKCRALNRLVSAIAETTNFRASLIDHHGKIQGGCSGCSQREFRELEMLDNITHCMYEVSRNTHGCRAQVVSCSTL
ncbi:uncharacterized protein BT62DRAFT_954692 [Guyanagaster necrorhizus]|uniref:Uncharacterized protein n=1 Tax=Guyanagaster necrorhizus TaxID=856835 RepID=A0A9P8ANS4_9AGAR|nr:uncharacterized protein BT62DRAFT_954692 [Guyanagaster necrorhizus MCA 3950]KAG7442608.1 hypothetical protein BT62DRAFT_954692 [Guyanagaster necrorhizus MCA 3950]